MAKGKTAKVITEARLREALDNYEGWCVTCQDWTRDQTEPDAQGYDCPACERKTIVGAEIVLFRGLALIVDDSKGDK
jgi:hypothetical protein